jgi:hypothetical protein
MAKPTIQENRISRDVLSTHSHPEGMQSGVPNTAPEHPSPDDTPPSHLKDADPGSQPADQSEVGPQVDGGGIDPRSQRLLLKVTATFPFQFFPDELIIDEMKVTYVRRTFFYSSQMRTILINDISDVLLEAAPFFATLRIISNSSKYPEIKITYLSRTDGVKAKKMLDGLIISRAQALQLNKFNQQQLQNKIVDLGTYNNTKIFHI